MHDGDMGAWAWSMMAVMALVWIAIPALIAWAIWVVSRSRHEPPTPLELLKQTYARGQITHDQFEQMKRDLA
jgi:uncharacterized membrane protein